MMIQGHLRRAAAPATVFAVAALTIACSSPAPAEKPAATAPPPRVDPARAAREKIIARGKSLELPTKGDPVPGDALSHNTSGYAKTMCSAVFITGYDIDFAAEHVGYFAGPYEERSKVGKPVVDTVKKTVSIRLPNGRVRTAVYTGSQGCVTYPEGRRRAELHTQGGEAEPATGRRAGLADGGSHTEDAATGRSGRGQGAGGRRCRVLDGGGRDHGVRRHLQGAHHRRALRRRHYQDHAAREWSMGKSVTATIMGTLMHRGVYTLEQPAPVPEWQGAGDPRKAIEIQDILHMSSGLAILSPSDPDFDPKGPYPHHLYLYTDAGNAFKYAASRPQQWKPNTVGRYRNTDPVLINYLNRLGIEKLKLDYLSYPQRALWDKIGVRSMVMETDPSGNFLTQGYEYMSGRDWARLGNLYLNDGVTPGGERILPEYYNDFVSTLAPAWVADENPVYGGFFWINGDGRVPLPKTAYSMQGAGGQSVWIDPAHDLVVVRLGNYRGQSHVNATLNKALEILVTAVPKH